MIFPFESLLATVLRLACIVTLATSVSGQSLFRLAPLAATIEDRHTQVTVQVTHPGTAAVAGYGAVSLRCYNPDVEARVVRATLRSPEGATRRVEVQLDVRLAAGERRHAFLPAPCCGENLALGLAIDGTERVRVLLESFTTGALRAASPIGTLTSLAISDRSDFEAVCAAHVRQVRAMPTVPSALPVPPHGLRVVTSAAPAVDLGEPMQRPTDDLPLDWRLLSGFERIILDGRTPLGAEVQAMLVAWLRSGGALFVSGADALPAGALRDMLGPAPVMQPSFRVGAGRLAGTALPLPSAPTATTLASEFVTWSSPHGAQVTLPRGVLRSTPAWCDWLVVDNVPGIVGMRADLFFILICGFVLLVGPLNHLVLARHRRPWLSLVFVPALGFGTAALILLLSLVQEGMTSRSVRRTFTMLDQREHDALTIETRSIFAGVSPPSIGFTDEALVQPVSLTDAYDDSPPTFRIDAERGRIGGEMLRSRTPTSFVVISQAPCRERLRFDFTANPPTFELSGALSLVEVRGALVVRDPRGSFWLSDEVQPGTLSRVEESTALRAIAERFSPLAHDDVRGSAVNPWLEARARQLNTGEYVGEFRTGLEAFPVDGLAAEQAAGVHVIYGRLDERDAVY